MLGGRPTGHRRPGFAPIKKWRKWPKGKRNPLYAGLRLLNAPGQGGKADNLWQETATLRWEGLPAGLYSVILVDAKGKRYVGKVAVE